MKDDEPMLAGKGSGSDRDKVHEFLDQYYEESIQAVRQILPEEFLVVLFSWTYNFDRYFCFQMYSFQLLFCFIDGRLTGFPLSNMEKLSGIPTSTPGLNTTMKKLRI